MHAPLNLVPLVAIVDDDKDDRLFLKEGFISAGFCGAFLEFSNAISFKEWIGEHSAEDKFPDVLLLDINMPRLNGIEFLQLMAGNSNLNQTKTFIVSTSCAEKDRIECSQLGVHHFFTKPPDITGYEKIARECFALLSLDPPCRACPGSQCGCYPNKR